MNNETAKSWDEIKKGSFYELSQDVFSGLNKVAAGTKVICTNSFGEYAFVVLEGPYAGDSISEHKDDEFSSPEKYIAIDMIMSKIPSI